MNPHERYLGMRVGDLDGKPYANFWNPRMEARLPDHVHEAVTHGPVAISLLPPVADAAQLLDPTSEALENGYALGADGALHIVLRTMMPGTSPAMVDWWFGWHSDEPQRYKLWHPRAHVHAAWGSPAVKGATGRDRYVGRVSYVDEYLGSELGQYAIRFIPPAELGLNDRSLADPQQATAVCARVGYARFPLDFGYLIHHVRRVADGAEMRSRFWVGGPYGAARAGGFVARPVIELAKRFKKPKPTDGHALLVHCSTEMTRLASFLPRLYAELRDVP